MTALYVSQFLLWIVVLLLGVVVLALARQVGVLHERLAPVGALTIKSGVDVGSQSPVIETRSLSGAPMQVGAHMKEGEVALLLFVSSLCSICKKIIPLAKQFARSEALHVTFVGDGELSAQQRLIADFGISPEVFVNDSQLGMTYGVTKLPYAVLLDHSGKVVAKGLVNSREHLESLIVAHESGFSSVQSYLTANKITALRG